MSHEHSPPTPTRRGTMRSGKGAGSFQGDDTVARRPDGREQEAVGGGAEYDLRDMGNICFTRRLKSGMTPLLPRAAFSLSVRLGTSRDKQEALARAAWRSAYHGGFSLQPPERLFQGVHNLATCEVVCRQDVSGQGKDKDRSTRRK